MSGQQRVWAAAGERWDDDPALVAQRRTARDLYAAARCLKCNEVFANYFVLWRHRTQDMHPDQQRCLSERQLYRLGMYRVAGHHKGDGVWHDDRRELPLGPGVEMRGFEQTEGLPDLGSETRAAACSCADISGESLP